MQQFARRKIAGIIALVAATVAVPRTASTQRASDSSFAALVTRLSEPGGYFDSDNIITNELSYLQVADQLKKAGATGGVYIGVGPDQNFSYIALIRPSIAFLIDIRRDNLLEHLLFKSIFELSRNRLEYLCLLFGLPVPAAIDAWTGKPLSDLLAYVARSRPDSQTVRNVRARSDERITRFGVSLDARDREMIERYRMEFITDRLDTRYSSLGRNNRGDYPTFGMLIAATDRSGNAIGYLASESAFQYVRDMQVHDRIVPIIGNVAGPKAVRAIGQYATEHRLGVSAFYLSNVEQYLMTRDGGFDAYAANVKALPHDSTSVIIRSYFGRFGRTHPLFAPAPGNVSTSTLETIDSFLHAYAAGELTNYPALVNGRYIQP